ncbi:hypothetical protein ACLOJK_040457 [Asimina triloba]
MFLAAQKRQDEVVDILPGLSALRVSDLPDGVVLGPLHSLFSLLLHRMALYLPHAAAVAVNTVHHLDSTILGHLQTNFRTCPAVGPLSLLSPPPRSTPDLDAAGHQCLAWLDGFSHSPASVAYVSFGSFLTPPPAELAALAAGLEASGAPFVWSLKEKAWEGLPCGFLARVEGRGLVVPWAPQVEVLSHAAVGVFVTHCGWNSVMESVSGGVPMICRPFFGDQKVNGRMVSEVWKIGVGVEGGVLSEDGVAAAVDLVLRKEEGRGMRERAGGLREVAKQAVADGGSSRTGVDALLQIINPDPEASLA